MFDFAEELHPLSIGTDNSGLFERKLQFNKYLYFDKGFYIKHRARILYLTDTAKNFSPISVVLSNDEYVKVREIFERCGEFELMLDVSGSRIISCRQLKITGVPFKAVQGLTHSIDECLSSEKEYCFMQGVISELMQHIISKNDEKLQEYISGLIGLGEGLTPDFDDFLVGSSWFFDAFHNDADIIKKSIREGLKKKSTTSVSSAFYLHAFQNEYSYNLIKLGKAVEEQELHKMKDILHEIQCYGHTSGKYLLYGILAGINAVNALTELKRSFSSGCKVHKYA